MLANLARCSYEVRQHIYDQVIESIAVHRVGDRPNRFEPRKEKPATSDVDLSQFKVSTATGTPPPPEPPNTDDPGTLPDSMLHVPGFVAELMEHCLDTAPYPNPTLACCGALALQAMLAPRKIGAAHERTKKLTAKEGGEHYFSWGDRI